MFSNFGRPASPGVPRVSTLVFGEWLDRGADLLLSDQLCELFGLIDLLTSTAS